MNSPAPRVRKRKVRRKGKTVVLVSLEYKKVQEHPQGGDLFREAGLQPAPMLPPQRRKLSYKSEGAYDPLPTSSRRRDLTDECCMVDPNFTRRKKEGTK
jgi:hypothetical protein